MFEIRIRSSSFFVGESSVRFNEYFVKHEDFKRIKKIWQCRLQSLGGGTEVILPHSIDEEYVDAFSVFLDADGLAVMTCNRLDVFGYDDDLDVITVMSEAKIVCYTYPEPFVKVRVNELINAVDRF